MTDKTESIGVSPEIICPSCHATVPADSYFCPHCGKPLKDKPPALTLSRQIVVYSVSLFLPPFGFWYAWKYLKQPDSRSQSVGIAAMVLTIISTAAAIWLSVEFVNSFNQAINSVPGLNLY